MTDRCNLRCIYCMPNGDLPKLAHEEILTYEEILRLARLGADMGVNKIRLTGGEPLVRKGLVEFIPRLAALPGLKDLALTTNGILLKNNLEKVHAGGINRLNISLDTLNPEKYRKITGFDGFHRVWGALTKAREMDFSPIKINVVLMKGINDVEALDFAGLSLKYPYHIRFIEHMPICAACSNINMGYVPSHELKKQLKSMGELMPVTRTEFDGPAERFKFAGAPGEIGFISPLTNHFCHQCNRLRLTAAGKLRMCLLSKKEVDLKGPMRKGISDEDLKQRVIEAALKKPKRHCLDTGDPKEYSGNMSSIGG